MSLDFQGNNLEILRCRANILRVEGGAGTGKTLAIMLKLHAMCEHYPGTQVRILRDTKTSLNGSVIPQWMSMIGDTHPCHSSASPENISMLRYPNGSIVIFGGLDNIGRLMGPDIDFVWVNEATVNVKFEDVQYLITRFRGKVRSPYRQLILDCNPSFPEHFMNTWVESADNVRVKSRHQDNPLLHDGKDWTDAGREYLKNIGDNMTGAGRKRMLNGEWAAQDGAVFELLEARIHQFSESFWPKGIPELPAIIGLDWGIADPFAAVLCLLDKENKAIFVLDERYQAGLTAAEQCKLVGEMARLCDIRALYFDPSMSNRQARGAEGQYGPPPIDSFRGLPFPLKPGLNQTRLANIEFLMKLVNNAAHDHDDWAIYIHPRCANLWKEMSGAAWHKDQRGLFHEDIDPRLPDHAITALYYALRTCLQQSSGIQMPVQFDLRTA